MNYHLSSKAVISRLKISRQFWIKSLGLANFYGWQPRGTRPPSPSLFILLGLEIEAWNGTYLPNESQTVTTEDALSLARALEKSLDDIPDFNIEMDRTTKFHTESDLSEWLSPDEITFIEERPKNPPVELNEALPFEYFAGDEKKRLVNLIRFCRLGSFLILRI
jgi:hypothetical protein